MFCPFRPRASIFNGVRRSRLGPFNLNVGEYSRLKFVRLTSVVRFKSGSGGSLFMSVTMGTMVWGKEGIGITPALSRI